MRSQSPVPIQKPPIDSRELVDPLCWLLAAIVSGLTFIRWWQPTEGSIQGDTLGVVLGWFVALALLGWIGLRGTSWTRQIDRLQWAVWMLAGGQLLSGSIILATSGDKRAALNLMWEWLALAIAFPLLRLVLKNAAGRREWMVIGLGAVMTLSAYGLFQRIYVFPQTISEYRQVRNELDALERAASQSISPDSSYGIQTRIQQLQSKLLKLGLQPHMLAGSSRISFEGRLLHSTEILGRFALANTFAGLLLVWLIVLVLQSWTQFRKGFDLGPDSMLDRDTNDKRILLQSKPSPWSNFILAASVGLIGYVLLLTKSRTAFLATIAALGLWFLYSSLISRPKIRQVLLWVMLALIAVGVLVFVAGWTGGIDRLVLAEASKSLQYRLEYWWSSAQVIREAPILGVGPGQFRQHYLVYKLPRSSEEIADPHNLFLDVWANGGLLALIGLIWLIVELFRRHPAKQRSDNEPLAPSTVLATSAAVTHPPAEKSQVPISIGTSVRESGSASRQVRKISQPTIPRSGDAGRNGIGSSTTWRLRNGGWSNPLRLSALASLIVLWLVGGALESPLLVLALSWAVFITVFDRVLSQEITQARFWKTAGCGLLIHLLGAGGIAMPAIVQLLIVVALFSQPVEVEGAITELSDPRYQQRTSRSSKIDLGEAAEPLQNRLAIAGLSSANRSSMMTFVSNVVLIVLGISFFAGCFYSSAQPVWRCVADLELGDIANLPQRRNLLYREAAKADPWSAEPWEKLANAAFYKWKLAQQPEIRDLDAAITAQQAAIERNPLAYHSYRTLGEFYSARGQYSNSRQDQRAAIEAFQKALQRYPHHAELNAVAAEAFYLAQEKELATRTAVHAIQQDDMNHAAGHSDKFLSTEMRKRMEELSSLE